MDRWGLFVTVCNPEFYKLKLEEISFVGPQSHPLASAYLQVFTNLERRGIYLIAKHSHL